MNSNFLLIAVLVVILISSFAFILQTEFPKTMCEDNFSATVSRVIDGDTIVVNECAEHLRLALVNTPEVNQSGYQEAKDYTSSLCNVGSKIEINQDSGQPHDYYGRIVAEIYCQNKNLNAELVTNNLAVIETQYCSRSEFATESWAWNNGCKNALE